MAPEVFSKNDSSVVVNMAPRKKDQIVLAIIVCIFLIVGIVGNLLALVKLAKKRNFRNGSYILMLRCLVSNNLIGLIGVVILMIVKRSLSEYSQLICACWVIFRFFGMSSGCISMIMSIDRYMIINHPIFYQKHFTRQFNRNAIIGFSLIAGIITFLPFFGFGIYYDGETKQCLRYRDAKTLPDRAYAILFLIFGSLICLTIVTCNTLTMKAILFNKRRRISISSSSSSQANLTKASTFDIKFSKLIAFLSLTFVICWMPQMISIILALKSNPLPQGHWFFKLADTLIGLVFALDPYVYVLSGKNLMQLFCCCRSKRSSNYRNQFSIINSTLD